MATNPFPPQGFDKDTLTKAYEWLQNQPAHIKDAAKTSALLVSLYTKAKNHGEQALDHHSLTSFKSELKSLAGMIGEFEGPENGTAPQTPVTPPANAAPLIVHPKGLGPSGNASAPAKSIPPVNPPLQTPSLAEAGGGALDPRSQVLIQEIQSRMNLGSSEEALRLLISVGYQRLKDL